MCGLRREMGDDSVDSGVISIQKAGNNISGVDKPHQDEVRRKKASDLEGSASRLRGDWSSSHTGRSNSRKISRQCSLVRTQRRRDLKMETG